MRRFSSKLLLVIALSATSAQADDFLTMCGGGTGALPSPWQRSGNDVSYTTGNVGIGTETPTATLDVNGTIKANDALINGLPVQSRVSGTCPEGSAIREVKADGAVNCGSLSGGINIETYDCTEHEAARRQGDSWMCQDGRILTNAYTNGGDFGSGDFFQCCRLRFR